MINPKKVGKASVALGLSVLMLGSNVSLAESYKLSKPVKVYSTAYDSKYRTNPITTFSTGTYNIFRRYDGQINISKSSNPGGWINPDDAQGSVVADSSSDSSRQESVEETTSYKATAYVNVRTGAGTKYKKLGTIAYGEIIEGVKEGGWIKLTYKGRTAYTSADYYQEVTSGGSSNDVVQSSPRNYIATTSVYVRPGKGSSYGSLGISNTGDVINGVIDGPWIRFSYKGQTAYTAAAYYEEYDGSSSNEEYTTEYTTDTSVYIRNGKSSRSSKIGISYPGDVIEGVIDGPWIRFSYKGQTAYTAAAYYYEKGTEQVESDPFEGLELREYRADTSVYARSRKSSKESTKVGIVSKGEIIEGAIDGPWIKFRLNGDVAYTAKAYYTDVAKEAKQPLNEEEISYLANYAVNVRSGAGVNNGKIGLIAAGSTIRGVKEGNWIRFTYNNRQAYTAAEYYTPLSIPETDYNVSPRQAFINRIAPTAKVLANNNDLYASVMIAQCVLETGFGTSWLSSSDINNLFGIKGHYNGQYVVLDAFEYNGSTRYYEVAHFKKYPSIAESMMDYIQILTAGDDTSSWRYNYYLGARKSQTSSYKDATYHLTGKYATAPDYYIALNQLIEQYNLTQYDN